MIIKKYRRRGLGAPNEHTMGCQSHLSREQSGAQVVAAGARFRTGQAWRGSCVIPLGCWSPSFSEPPEFSSVKWGELPASFRVVVRPKC
jgi:hypothetical protein